MFLRGNGGCFFAAGDGPTPGFRGAMPIGMQTVRRIISVASG